MFKTQHVFLTNTFFVLQNSFAILIIRRVSCLSTSVRNLCLPLCSRRCSAIETILEMNMSAMQLKPRPPSFRGEYRRSTLLFRWKFPPWVNVFLVLMSISSIPFLVQSNTPNVGTRTGTANVLCASILFFEYSSDFQIYLTLLWLYCNSGPLHPILTQISICCQS